MKKKILLTVLILISVSFFSLTIVNFHLQAIKVELNEKSFKIDKISDLVIQIKTDFFFLKNVRISPMHPYIYNSGKLEIKNVSPGENKIFIRWYFGFWRLRKSILNIIKIEPLIQDKNLNGFPDVVELSGEDAENFRNWFVNIANSLYYHDTKFWKKSQRDCAGFVRFCFKEALKKHDKYWINELNYKGKIFKDIKKYNYPNVPYLGVDIFRIKSGLSLSRKNFSFYASGRVLKEENLQFVTKDIDQAQAGDILVYFHPQDPDFPFHLMIYLGNMGMRNDYGWVIYHTGPINSLGGELRKVKISDLMHADPSWLPLPSNRNFLGFFKFKILN